MIAEDKAMSKLIMTALLASTMACVGCSASAKDSESQAFITKAIEGNMAEVEMGKLAQSQGQSEQVKSFGAMLVQDHTDANTKAMDAARQLGVTPPYGPSKKQMADHDRLAKLSGAKFDQQFATFMVTDHKKDIAEYTKESKMKTQDAAVTYASAALPTLKKHLESAQSLTSVSKKTM